MTGHPRPRARRALLAALALLVGSCGGEEGYDLVVLVRASYAADAFDAVFVGVEAADGVRVERRRREVRAGDDFTADVEVAVLRDLPPGRYELTAELLLGDEAVASETRSVGLNATTSSLFVFRAPDAVADPVVALSAGARHTCALHDGGAVRCWGDGTEGQLGDGTRTPRAAVREVVGLADATALAAMPRHGCALRASGALACWGENAFGQLGVPASAPQPTPQPVAGLDDVVEVAGGARHTCARRAGGAVHCWGDNLRGQLGDEAVSARHEPAAVGGITGAVDLACGEDFCCAVTGGGTVECWGLNDRGQLGDGSDDRVASRPRLVVGLDDARAIGASAAHACAVTADGSVWCWGANDRGQLGDGTRESRPLPVSPALPGPARAVAVGGEHTCALLEDGALACWGAGDAGQRLSGDRLDERAPALVEGGPFDAVAAGARHTCALRTEDAQVICAGANGAGQSGAERVTHHPSPRLVMGVSDAQAVAVGAGHACALRRTGEVSCWGEGPIFDGLPDLLARDLGAPVADATELRSGAAHLCARGAVGEAVCWGHNGRGQLGDGTRTRHVTPTTPGVLGEVAALALGDARACALDADGAVACWGAVPGDEDRLGPTPIALDEPAVGIGGGGETSCAWAAAGAPWCWGRAEAGQAGAPAQPTLDAPRALEGLPEGDAVQELVGGPRHLCARLASGAVVCLGDNGSGQLGDGSAAPRETPVAVIGIGDAVALAAGYAHTCAVLAGGGVRCWGAGGAGQLGDGALTGSASPVDVVDLTAVDAIGAHGATTCAAQNGQVFCWGADRFTVLADGAPTSIAEPLRVVGLYPR